jgi:hypothetical protein
MVFEHLKRQSAWLSRRDRTESRDLRLELCCSTQQVSQEFPVHVEMAFVFREIAQLVRLAQDPRDLRAEPERVRHCLEHEVTILRTISVPTQSRERNCVCGVVRQGEAARARKRLAAGVELSTISYLRHCNSIDICRFSLDFELS